MTHWYLHKKQGGLSGIGEDKTMGAAVLFVMRFMQGMLWQVRMVK